MLQYHRRSRVQISAGVFSPIVQLRYPQVESAEGMEQAIPVGTLEPPSASATFM